jgi:hypothetical protein
MADEICGICGEPRSAHVVTDKGPLTHPREARGEGEYVLVKPAHIEGRFWPDEDEVHVPAAWMFVPTHETRARETAIEATKKKNTKRKRKVAKK